MIRINDIIKSYAGINNNLFFILANLLF